MLQDAEDNYYLTANYVLGLVKRAYELFELQKPFDATLNYADRKLWLRVVNNVRTIIAHQDECLYISDLRRYASE